MIRLIYVVPLALLPLAPELTDGEMIMLWLITLAICWLCLRPNLLRRPIRIGISTGSVVVGLAYAFAAALVLRMYDPSFIIAAAVHLVLLTIIVGLCYRHRSILMPIRGIDLFAWIGSAIFILNKSYWYSTYGLDNLFFAALYPEAAAAFYFAVVCSFIIRLERLDTSGRIIREGLTVATVCFALVGIVGLVYYGAALYYTHAMVADLHAGNSVGTRIYAARLANLDISRHHGPINLENALSDQLDALGPGDNQRILAELGLVAMRHQAWDAAFAAYQRLVREVPSDHMARVRLASARFELGGRLQGLKDHVRLADHAESNAESWLALGIARVKRGEWDQATSAFAAAIDRVRWSPPATGEVQLLRLEEDVDYALQAHLKRIKPYEWSAYFSSRGWAFLSTATTIGHTGVASPAELMSLSGGGSSMYEEIMTRDKHSVSMRKRGYNIAVIDPSTGQLDGMTRFDTWENRAEGARLAYFLRTIPRGKVVMGSINDEGSGGLTLGAKSALRSVGTRRLPSHWGSHAFIGVKGKTSGSALEAVSDQDNGRVVVGALSGNVPETAAVGSELEHYLLEAARAADGGKAIFLSPTGDRALIAIADG